MSNATLQGLGALLFGFGALLCLALYGLATGDPVDVVGAIVAFGAAYFAQLFYYWAALVPENTRYPGRRTGFLMAGHACWIVCIVVVVGNLWMIYF